MPLPAYGAGHRSSPACPTSTSSPPSCAVCSPEGSPTPSGRWLAPACRPRAGAAAERPRAGSPAADDALVREIYDPDREGFDGYDVPSYDGGGKPVAVPVRRAAVPGYDWRVLRAVYFPTAMRNYLDLMTSLIEAEPGGTGEGAFADRVMYEDIEDDERTITRCGWLN